MSASKFPRPTAKALEQIRLAIAIAQRKAAGESLPSITRDLGLTSGRADFLRVQGNLYLAASPFIRRLKEGAPLEATAIINFINYDLDCPPGTEINPDDLAAKVKAKVRDWRKAYHATPKARKADINLGDDAFYLKYRQRCFEWSRNMGRLRISLFFAWLDECRAGLIAPVALERLPSRTRWPLSRSS